MFCGMLVMMLAFIVAALVQLAIQVEYFLFIYKFNSQKKNKFILAKSKCNSGSCLYKYI
jgi:hypothetical protein